MGNEKTIKKIPCKLIKIRFTKRGKNISETIDSNATCKISILSDEKLANKGILKTSKPLNLYQSETIKIEYELELERPKIKEKEILRYPIRIINCSIVKGKTKAEFLFVNVLEHKRKCILIEFKIAKAMSEIGIQELLKVQRSFYDHVYLPLLLLSWSFERFLKCLLSLIVVDDKRIIEPTPFDEKGSKGHNLDLQVKELLLMINDAKYSNMFATVQQEIDYLEKNEVLDIIVKALSEFGIGARYYYIDIILKGTSQYRNPSYLWDNIENNMHSLAGKKSPPAGSEQLEKEMKQLTIEPIKEFRRILIKLIDLVGKKKFSDFYKIDTNMTYVFDFNLKL